MKKEIIYRFAKAAGAIFFLFSFIQLSAQTIPAHQCSGSGVPVRLTTIDSSTSSLPTGKTNYIFTKDACPAQGSYTITDSVPVCFGNSWGLIPANSTGGNFMLVNADATPGGIYTDTINNICGNTYYTFSESIVFEALPSSCGGHPTLPQLLFTIETTDGQGLANIYADNSQFTGSAPHPIDFTGYFTTPPGTSSVIIKVINNAPGACGNVFLLSGIAVVPCVPSVNVFIESALCTGSNSFTTLSATVGQAYSSPSFQWQKYNGTSWVDISGANSLNYSAVADTGASSVYRFTVAESTNTGIAHCSTLSDTIPVYNGIPNAKGIAASNSPVCENGIIRLSATGGQSYQWTGPAGFTSMESDPSFKATGNSEGEYVVVISDGHGCETTASATVSTLPAPNVQISSIQNICAGDSVTLQASGGISYSWLPVNNLSAASVSNPIAKPIITTTYIVTVTATDFCTDTASVQIVVSTKPIISAGEDKAIIKGQSSTLDGSVEKADNINFSWQASPSLNDILSLNPVVNPVINTDYILTATSTAGCGTSLDTVSVKVYNGLSIPNAFTPNGDGINDVWHIPALQVFTKVVVSVYNRYGQKVFESTGHNKDWDGRFNNILQPPGTYAYVIDLKNNSAILKGTVIIIR